MEAYLFSCDVAVSCHTYTGHSFICLVRQNRFPVISIPSNWVYFQGNSYNLFIQAANKCFLYCINFSRNNIKLCNKTIISRENEKTKQPDLLIMFWFFSNSPTLIDPFLIPFQSPPSVHSIHSSNSCYTPVFCVVKQQRIKYHHQQVLRKYIYSRNIKCACVKNVSIKPFTVRLFASESQSRKYSLFGACWDRMLSSSVVWCQYLFFFCFESFC